MRHQLVHVVRIVSGVLLLGIGGCTASDRPRHDPSEKSGFAPGPGVPLKSGAANSPSDFVRTCLEGAKFPENPPYDRGVASTHPAALLLEKVPHHYMGIPPERNHYPKGWFVDDRKGALDAQLAVCVERDEALPIGKRCESKEANQSQSSLTVSVYEATYRVRIIEARTGKLLYEKRIQGDNKDCPRYIYEGDGGPSRYYSDISPERLRRSLEAYISP